MAGAKVPNGFEPDGKSLVEFLKGGPAPKRDSFYWELHEGQGTNSIQAVRWEDWKTVRSKPVAAVELHYLTNDLGERNNLAAEQPKRLAKAVELMAKTRIPHPLWLDPALPPGGR